MNEVKNNRNEDEGMTNTITVDQLKELLQIQKDFDSRIPTLNLQDSKVAYVVEFFEWFNTLETFKNWKKNPGKPLDVQLDELSDLLAFGLSIANQLEINNDMLNALVESIKTGDTGDEYNLSDKEVSKNIIRFFPLAVLGNEEETSLLVICTPFAYAVQYYTIDQLITAYKKKMERNHARQDGTADTDKGYI